MVDIFPIHCLFYLSSLPSPFPQRAHFRPRTAIARPELTAIRGRKTKNMKPLSYLDPCSKHSHAAPSSRPLVRAHIHSLVHTSTSLVCVARVHSHMHAYAHACIRTCTHMHTHMRMHTHMHADTQIYSTERNPSYIYYFITTARHADLRRLNATDSHNILNLLYRTQNAERIYGYIYFMY